MLVSQMLTLFLGTEVKGYIPNHRGSLAKAWGFHTKGALLKNELALFLKVYNEIISTL